MSRITKVAILSVLFLFGCAGRGPLVVTDRPLPDVRLGPEIPLLDVPVRNISAAIDQDGRIHVLALASKPQELHHLVIGMEGVVNREVVTSSDSYDHPDIAFDIAFDSSGNLHAIVDEDHFVLEEGTWRKLSKHTCVKLIRSGQDLFCLSRAEGEDVGAARYWHWQACDCFLPIPLPYYPDKLVLERKNPEGWSKLAVLDRGTRYDPRNPTIAADKNGTLHIIYGAGGECVYTRIEPMTLGESSESNQGFGSNDAEAPRTLTNLSGRVVTSKDWCDDIAADPETGTALITIKGYGRDFSSKCYSQIVEDGKIGPQVPMYDFYSRGLIDVEPAGEGRFLAIAIWLAYGFPRTYFIYYLEYRDGMWSAPVEVGKSFSVLLNAEMRMVLIYDLDRRAFALWTNTDRRPVARWIER